MNARRATGRAVSLSAIPGYREAFETAREAEFKTREDNFLAFDTDIAGFKVRTMTVRDYVALLRANCPLLHRREPTHFDLELFLWALSPQIERWHNAEAWRKPWLIPSARHWQRWQRKRKLFRVLQIAALEKRVVQATEEPYALPEEHPLTKAFVLAFAYVDRMFFDMPAAVKQGTESGLCYLTAWFDAMQSEYHLPTEEVWKMPLPVLFARLKAIQQRKNPQAPDFNAKRDALNRQIQQAMAGGLSGEQLLKDGVKFQTN